MKNAKLIVLCLCLAIFGLLLGGCGQSVGILDVNKIMTESPKVQEFDKQLQDKGKQLSDQLETEKTKLSNEQVQAKQDAYFSDLMKTKQTMETQIDDSIKQAAEQVAKEKKLSIILYKSGVAFGGTDVTQDVMNKMQ